MSTITAVPRDGHSC